MGSFRDRINGDGWIITLIATILIQLLTFMYNIGANKQSFDDLKDRVISVERRVDKLDDFIKNEYSKR